jgi:signal transduction histidine kinase
MWRNIGPYRFALRLIFLFLSGVIFIFTSGYISFLIGMWIPIAPPLLGMLISSVTISVYVYLNGLQELNFTLEKTVCNLEEALSNLEEALNNLEESQIKLIQGEKMSALGQLISGVAHEINNPVGFVSVNLKYLSEYITDLTNHLHLYQQSFPESTEEIIEDAETINLEYLLEDIPKILASMEVGAGRIQDISTSLRTFSRSDTVSKIPYNIHEGIDSTLLILKHRLKGSGDRSEIKIVKNYGELPLINCYPGQLNQVVMNLVANAIDVFDEFKPNQGSSETEAVNPEIKISTEILLDDLYVAIRVKDNGPGMTDEIKQKIFEKLFTTKAVGKGTGLGLSISRQIIVEAHGGRLDCISAPKAGAEFIIEIPIS